MKQTFTELCIDHRAIKDSVKKKDVKQPFDEFGLRKELSRREPAKSFWRNGRTVIDQIGKEIPLLLLSCKQPMNVTLYTVLAYYS
ncbi:hypothetical protein TUMSATVNIG3_33710 [Vibrio nigripulchritudo]|nr:hypothetical protein TUMSATVNIG2_33220 [Vibrio nigripulchritudo]BDU44573.1 hypothetical protein TUMSATVNIG3_33710 [Vibrio nigripulchritudo]